MRKSGKELIAARKKAQNYRSQGKSHQWIMIKLGYKSKGGVQQLLGERLDRAKCVECGCTENRACKGGCSWVETPHTGKFWVCSNCV